MSKENKVFVKLRDAGTIFFDMPKQIKIAGDQIVEVSKEGKVAEAISAGILVEVSKEDAKFAEAKTAEEKAAIADASKNEAIKLKAELEAQHKEAVDALTAEHTSAVDTLTAEHAEAIKVKDAKIAELEAELADLKKPAPAKKTGDATPAKN